MKCFKKMYITDYLQIVAKIGEKTILHYESNESISDGL